MFNVSDKVVCVFAGHLANATPCASRIVRGQIYCVEHVWFDANCEGDGWLIRLVGEAPEYATDGRELGWDAFRFRKLEEVKAENHAAREATSASPNPIAP